MARELVSVPYSRRLVWCENRLYLLRLIMKIDMTNHKFTVHDGGQAFSPLRQRPRSPEECLVELQRQKAVELAAREGFAALCAPILLPGDDYRRCEFDRLVACVVTDLVPVHTTALRVLVDVVATRWEVERLRWLQRGLYEATPERAPPGTVSHKLLAAMSLDTRIDRALDQFDRAQRRFLRVNRRNE